ncbi:MAG: bifunctional demethylmenaquinone methyltransferase/2-methoxy-6-polyprenyl-1,4-benzoquinol methylase UbiE [Planctomycetaceae bacterium]
MTTTVSPPTVDKSGERVRRMFGEIAPRYDLLNHLLSGGVDFYWRWRTVRAASPCGDAPILDVCTGTGDLALAYARAAHGGNVFGTDFTHEMLVRADAKQRNASDTQAIRFYEADTQRLPFGDDQFQIVSVAFGLRNVSDTRAGLREMTRVCRPGGRVVVLEFSTPRNRLFGGVYRWYFRHVLPRLGQWLARNQQSAYSYLPQSVSEFPDGPRLAEIMQECGLSAVTFRPLTFGISTLYIGIKPAVNGSDLSAGVAK